MQRALAALSINLALVASGEARKDTKSWTEDSQIVGSRFLKLSNKVGILNQHKYIRIQGKETHILNPISALKKTKYKIKFERDVRKIREKGMSANFFNYAAQHINRANSSLYNKPRKTFY